MDEKFENRLIEIVMRNGKLDESLFNYSKEEKEKFLKAADLKELADILEETEKELENELETESEEIEKTEDSPLCEIAKMFEDLRNLCSWLPADIQADFSNSIDKLRLDYLIEKLSGNAGLLKSVEEKSRDSSISGDVEVFPIQKEALCKTMEYLQSLATFLPNQQQAAILTRETGKVLERL